MNEKIIQIMHSQDSEANDTFLVLTDKGRIFSRIGERVLKDPSKKEYDPLNFKMIFTWIEIELPTL